MRNRNKPYRSVGVNAFNLWRAFIIVFVVTFIILLFIEVGVQSAFLIGLAAAISVVAIVAYLHYSEISSDGHSIYLKNGSRQIKISNLTNVETWWNYDFGISTRDITAPTIVSEKRRSLSNIINIYALIESEYDYAVIHEQIMLSTKFPNNHPYRIDKVVDVDRVIAVWDVDRCLEELELSPGQIK